MRSPLTLVSLALALCSAPSLVAASGAGHHEARSHLRHHARAGVRELRLRQRDGMSVLQAQVGKLFAVVFDDDTVDDAKLAKANKGSTTKGDEDETTTAKKALRTTTTAPTTTTTTTRRRTTTTTEESVALPPLSPLDTAPRSSGTSLQAVLPPSHAFR